MCFSDTRTEELLAALHQLEQGRTLSRSHVILRRIKNTLVGNSERKLWFVESGALSKLLNVVCNGRAVLDPVAAEELLAVLGTLCNGDCPPAGEAILNNRDVYEFLATSLQNAETDTLILTVLRTVRRYVTSWWLAYGENATFPWTTTDTSALVKHAQRAKPLIVRELLATMARWAMHPQGRALLLQADAMSVVIQHLFSRLHGESLANGDGMYDRSRSCHLEYTEKTVPVVVLEALAALLEDSTLAATPLARVMKTVPACGELFRTALHDTSPRRRFFSAKILVHLHLSKAMNLERELTTTVLPVLLGLLQMSCFSWHEEAWARFGIYHDRRASPQCPHLEETGELLAKLLDNSPPLQRVAFELDAIPALVNALQHTREVLFACPGSLLTKESKRSRLRLDRRPTPTTVLGVAGSSEKISDRTQRHIMAVLRAMAFIASDVEQARRILVDNELLDLLMELLDSARRAPKETTSGVVEATARVLASLLTSVHNRRRKGLHPGLVEHLLALAVDASAPLTVRFAACDALVQCSMPKCTLRSVLLDQQRGISRLMPIFRSCIHGWEASQGDQITNLGLESNGAWRATRMHGVRTQTSTSPFGSTPSPTARGAVHAEPQLVARALKIVRTLALSASSSEKKVLVEEMDWRTLGALASPEQPACIRAQAWALIHNLLYSSDDRLEHEACLRLVLYSPLDLLQLFQDALEQHIDQDARVHALSCLATIAAAEAIPLRAHLLSHKELLERLASSLGAAEALERFLAAWCFANLVRLVPYPLDAEDILRFKRKSAHDDHDPGNELGSTSERDHATKLAMEAIRVQLQQLGVLVRLRQTAQHDTAPDVRERARIALWNAQQWFRACSGQAA
ncbi:hypothetical protein CCYA_CCYA06G1832 [Cyanidiococcus yangmingshanensis]|nr:hypothetical protein CCYA_CCYA06G1832 [Cyanidiococcus yangmingshanensis]